MAKKGRIVVDDPGRKERKARYRAEILKGGILRLLVLLRGEFPEGDTFLVPGLSALRGAEGEVIEEGEGRFLFEVPGEGEYRLSVQGTGERSLALEGPRGLLLVQNPLVLRNSGTLPDPSLTPEAYLLVDYPMVTLPKDRYGTSERLDGGFKARRDCFAVYILLAHKDPRLLRRQYLSLTGRPPMLPLGALGCWDSRYYEYTDETVKEEVLRYEKEGLPLDYFVIDTDWRESGAKKGAGYKLNEKDFPDLPATFRWLHERGIRAMFNDHPEPVEGARSLMDPEESKYRAENLEHYLALGLDSWWYDRNWWTRLKAPVKEIRPETWGFHLYQDVTEAFHEKNPLPSGKVLRSLMMGNVDEVTNGEWKGIGNSASHRYGVQWTGDNWMSCRSLKAEFRNMLRAGRDMVPYCSSDLTGHIGDGSSRLYARWVEFGALSPIYRFHSTCGNKRYRQPWNYGEEGMRAAKEYGSLRYRLMPLYYALAHEAYETGMPLLRSLSFEDPSPAARREDVALLGRDLAFGLVPHEDRYYEPSADSFPGGIEATYYDGVSLEGEPVHRAKEGVLSFDWSRRCPIPGHGLEKWSASFEFDFRSPLPGKNVLLIGSDDGIRVWVDGILLDDSWGNRGFAYDEVLTLEGKESHHVRIEYFQDGGGAGLRLALRPVEEKEDIAGSYLPRGRTWIDLFSGKRRRGGRSFKGKYASLEIPLHVAEWGILPLLPDHRNASKMGWDRIALELFPGERSGMGRLDLYEDDGETLDYKDGKFRTTGFRLYRINDDVDELAFEVPKGTFDGPRFIKARHYVFRVHAPKGKKVVYCYDPGDGQVLPIKYIPRDEHAFPLKGKGGAPDGDVYEMEADVPLVNVGEMRLRFVYE